MDDEGRDCTKCKKYKIWNEFYPSKKGARGHESRCKACKDDYRRNQSEELRQRRRERDSSYHASEAGLAVVRRAKFKHLYGITTDEYDEVLGPQDGRCALCRLPETMAVNGVVIRLIVEHYHGCQAGHPPERACRLCIRGLTCHSCNRLLGIVERSGSLALAERFADYLERRPLL